MLGMTTPDASFSMTITVFSSSTLTYVNKTKEPATRKGHHSQPPYAQNDPVT